MSANDPLLAFREEFPILDTTNYLVSNSLGAMPRSVPDRLAEYTDEWAARRSRLGETMVEHAGRRWRRDCAVDRRRSG